ncbi:sensor histidine kinase [Niastella vici]|nr:ATP-binding protein [Niastella vici]
MKNIPPESIKLLVSTVQELSLTRDLDTVMKIVRTAARNLTGADGATFVLRDGDKCYYADEDAIAPLWKGSRFPMSACISGWAMLNRQPAVIEDIYADSRIPADAYKPTFVKSLAMVPIRTIDPIGAIGNYWAIQRMPTEEEVWLLQSLADITAVTIENVYVYAELEQRVKDRTRQLEAINQDLETFSYTVSHDLRAPLRTVTSFTSILLEDHAQHLSDEGKRIATKIVDGGKSMAALIDRLLLFFKNDKKELLKVLVPMSAIVTELTSDIKMQERNRDIEFLIHDLPNAQGDIILITEVWANLISNAVKYTRGKLKTLIEIGAEETYQQLVYYVKDNGAGFDMENYDKLFGVFQRLHASKEFEGTGVGLASVQRIITRHGGKVWANAKINEGAMFYFSLPAYRRPVIQSKKHL